jgi:hypothetical protein
MLNRAGKIRPRVFFRDAIGRMGSLPQFKALEQEGLGDADVAILQEAKMELWNLEQHERAYDWSVKRMHRIRFLMSFFGPCAAVIFLYLRGSMGNLVGR